jgi:NTP pyrophosphatase (non-canonical NTP hydrolase)
MMMDNSFDILNGRVNAWMDTHGMRANVSGWMLKLVEEVGELSGALVKEKALSEVEGEVADALICLLIVAACKGIDPLTVAHAKMTVNEGRTGRVNAMGIFVKSADLK